MSQFLSPLRAFFQAYGYPALWITIFIAAIGAPLPIDLLLLAAGAFAALGDFNIFVLALIAISSSVCGDNIGYLLGSRWGSQARAWLEHARVGKRLLPPHALANAHTSFTRYGGWAVLLSHCLIGALGGVMNLVAGSERFPYRTFLVCDIAGEMLGAILPLVLGLAFAASWEALGDVLGGLSFLLLSLLVTALLLVRLLGYAHRAKHGRARHASPPGEARCEPSGGPGRGERLK